MGQLSSVQCFVPGHGHCLEPEAESESIEMNPELLGFPALEPIKRPLTTKIAIVRHGERLDEQDVRSWLRSESGRNYPHDCPITAEGRRQAKKVGRQLLPHAFNVVVSSPFVRCVQTAIEICRELALPLCIDFELGEVFNSEFLGCKWSKSGPQLRSQEEIIALIPPSIRLLGSTNLEDKIGETHLGTHPAWPETVDAARLRFATRIESYASRGQRLRASFILVTHGHCVQTCLTLALVGKHGPDCNMSVHKVNYCSYVILERELELKNALAQEDEEEIAIPLDDGLWRLASEGIDVLPNAETPRGSIDCKRMASAMQRKRFERNQSSARRDREVFRAIEVEMRGLGHHRPGYLGPDPQHPSLHLSEASTTDEPDSWMSFAEPVEPLSLSLEEAQLEFRA